MLYSNYETCKWVAANIACLKRSALRLMDHLEDCGSQSSRGLLQVSRVCELPSDLNVYRTVCEQFLQAEYLGWVDKLLETRPSQQEVKFDKFAELVCEITQSRRRLMVLAHKQEFCSKPFVDWLQLVQSLAATGSDHPTNQLDLEQALASLRARYQINDSSIKAPNIQSAEAKWRIVLDSVPDKPNGYQLGIAVHAALLLQTEPR